MTTTKRIPTHDDTSSESDDTNKVTESANRNSRESSAESDTSKGDDYKQKHKKAFRICALNVGRLPIEKDKDKSRDTFQWMREMKADIILLSEIGLNWRNIKLEDNWYARTKDEFQRIASITGHNTHEKTKKKVQWGGTAIIAVNETASRVIQKGTDESGLGRWSWILLQGKDDQRIRCISIYSPPKYSKGPFSVWQQHCTKLFVDGKNIDPVEDLTHSFEREIKKWTAEGEKLIIGGDVNQNITNSAMQRMLDDNGLKEVILSRLDTNTETHIWNRSGVAIDSIWCTDNMTPTNTGYTEYSRWDHRTAWCDLHKETVFGEDRGPTTSFTGRKLLLDRPLTTKKYLREYLKLFKEKKLGERIDELRNETQGMIELTTKQKESMNEIDEDRTKAMLQAEKKCRNIRVNKVPYSPAVALAAKKMNFWLLLADKIKGKKVNGRYLARMKKQAGIPRLAKKTNLDVINKEASKARRRYLAMKKKAELYRKSFLEERAGEAAAEGNTSLEKALKNIKEREKLKEVYKKIRFVLGKNITSKGISIVIGPIDGVTKTHTAEKQIVQCCMNENKSKYSQAHGSKLCNTRIIRQLGRFGTKVKNILNRYQNAGARFDSDTRELLDAMHTEDQVPEWTDRNRITLKSHVEGWRKQNERTASGPSGLHFGTWKANCRINELARADATMRDISLRTGFVLERWKRGTDVQLMKQEGNFNVNKLRTICLLEADLNQNNKYIGKTAIGYAEKMEGLADEQFGSRKKRRATEVSVNNRITDDLMRLYAMKGAICSNDAKSCYDRIGHIALSLSLQRMGVPKQAIEGMLNAIQELKHHVKTSFGISKQTYGSNSKDLPLQGIPQGHGAAPTGWALLSTPIIEAMRQRGYGFKFMSPINRTKTQFVCFAFVDDTDLVHTFNEDQNFESMQEVVSTWVRNLMTTGGAIVPDKSYWYPIDFVWKKGEWKYKAANETEAEITIPDPVSGEWKNLAKLEVTEARRALGVMVRHDGIQKDNALFLRKKAEKWASCVNAKQLKPSEAETAMKTTVWRTLCYPLAATTFTEKECKYITSPIYKSALPVMGLQRRFARTLLHGHTTDLGLGVSNLYHEQLAAHMDILVRHKPTSTLTGKLLNASLESILIETGDLEWSGKNILIWSKLIRNNWLIETALQAHTMQMRLEATELKLTQQREKDKLIMTEVCNWTNDLNVIRLVNNCRKHLNVMWLSDLLDQDGATWLEGIFEGEYPINGRSTLIWPPVGHIPKRQWNKWKDIMNTVFAGEINSETIKERLGVWTYIIHKMFEIIYNEEEDRCYTKEGSNWRMWSRVPTRTRVSRYKRNTLTEVPDPFCIVNGYFRGGMITMKSYAKVKKSDQNEEQLYEDKCKQLPPCSRWAVARSKHQGSRDAMNRVLMSGTGVIVCDGSVKDGTGVAAFTIQEEEASSKNFIRGVSITPKAENMQSQRAELAGIYSALTALKVYANNENLQPTRMVVACDNISALRVFNEEFLIKPNEADADLFAATRTLSDEMDIKFVPKHVKGHQDKDNEYNELSELSKLNVQMDGLAKMFGKIVISQSLECETNGKIYGERWRLWRGNNKLTRFDSKAMSKLVYQSEIRKIWERSRKVRPNMSEEIDWEAIGKVCSRLDNKSRITTVKLLSGEYGTNKRLNQRGDLLHSKCPRCGQEEDSNHLWKCQSVPSQEIWKEGFKKLKKELRSFPTEKRLLEVMMTNLEKEVKDLPPYTPFRFGSVHHKLFQNQTKTGWDAMLKGFLHKDWRKIQSEYLQFCKSKKDVNQWLNKVIRRIWQIAWKQWEDRNETKHNIRENNEQLQHSIQKLIDHIDVRLQQNENQQYDNMDKQRIESKNQRKEWLNHMIERLSISTEDELPITNKEWSAIKTWRMR